MASEVSNGGVDVLAVSLLRSTDPVMQYYASDLVLQVSRRSRLAPAPAYNPGGGGVDMAKAMIGASGLDALWGLCSNPSQMACPVALEALGALLSTAAAMSRSSETSEAVFALVSNGAVQHLIGSFVDPALMTLVASTETALDQSAMNVVTIATSSLLVLHFLAANPDPTLYVLFLAATGIDADWIRGRATSGDDPWNIMFKTVDSAKDGRGGAQFIEASLLMAGSICGAPPLPALVAISGDKEAGMSSASSLAAASAHADEVARILPAYNARAQDHTCQMAIAVANSYFMANQALLWLNGGGGDRMDPNTRKISRAAVRLVWALSRGSGIGAMDTSETLGRLMELLSRRSGNRVGLYDDMPSGILVLDTIAAFMKNEDRGPQSSAISSPETQAAIASTVGELCELVLDGSLVSGHDRAGEALEWTLLAARTLGLLATVAGNPRLRPLLVNHPRFHAVLDLLVTKRHLDGSSPVSVVGLVVVTGRYWSLLAIGSVRLPAVRHHASFLV